MSARRVDLETMLKELADKGDGLWTADACGVTRQGTPMPALVHGEAYAADTTKHRILVIGGLSGDQRDVMTVQSIASAYAESDSLKAEIAMSIVLCGNPDGMGGDSGPGNGVGGDPTIGYPPTENFFLDEQNPESRYLWRWASFMAPDAVLEVAVGNSQRWDATDPSGR
ncbi:MAG: hypothetical protein QF368_07690, partial [SAR202 cluster bacterium]|nr:hypothetical protein [SAR202 cluster bacterium]